MNKEETNFKKEEEEIAEILKFLFYICWGLILAILVRLGGILTRFPPFSSFFRDKMFHYRNRFYLRAVKIIEKETERLKMPVLISLTEEMSDFICYYLEFGIGVLEKVNLNPRAFLSIIEKKLGCPEESIYLRESEKPFIKRLLIPKNYIFPAS